MSCELEYFLARLYTEPELRQRFLDDPARVLAGAALSGQDKRRLLTLDRAGLQMHARSLAAKRRNPSKKARPRLWDRLRALLLMR